jgi:Putative quorum-sensing-regulated virulence factor
LSELERRLVRLALDSSAQGGEISTSATKLIKSLRSRGVDGSVLLNALEGGTDGAEVAVRMSRPDWGLTVMPWGKFKGQMFADIQPDYLRWAQQWILEDEKRAARFKDLAYAIEQFLKQGT